MLFLRQSGFLEQTVVAYSVDGPQVVKCVDDPTAVQPDNRGCTNGVRDIRNDRPSPSPCHTVSNPYPP